MELNVQKLNNENDSVKLTATQILGLVTKEQDELGFQRILREDPKYKVLQTAYMSCVINDTEPEVKKAVHITKSKDNKIIVTDGWRSLNAASTAGYTGKFHTIWKFTDDISEAARQVRLHNDSLIFPKTKIFALEFEHKKFIESIANKLVKVGLFAKYADEAGEDTVPLLTIAELFYCFITKEGSPNKRFWLKTIVDSKSYIPAFIDHMHQFAVLRARMKRAASRESMSRLSVMKGFASVGVLSQRSYTNLSKYIYANYGGCDYRIKGNGAQVIKGWRRSFVSASR